MSPPKYKKLQLKFSELPEYYWQCSTLTEKSKSKEKALEQLKNDLVRTLFFCHPQKSTAFIQAYCHFVEREENFAQGEFDGGFAELVYNSSSFYISAYYIVNGDYPEEKKEEARAILLRNNLLSYRFPYINDSNELCAISIILPKNNPQTFIISVTKNTDKPHNEREVILWGNEQCLTNQHFEGYEQNNDISVSSNQLPSTAMDTHFEGISKDVIAAIGSEDIALLLEPMFKRNKLDTDYLSSLKKGHKETDYNGFTLFVIPDFKQRITKERLFNEEVVQPQTEALNKKTAPIKAKIKTLQDNRIRQYYKNTLIGGTSAGALLAVGGALLTIIPPLGMLSLAIGVGALITSAVSWFRSNKQEKADMARLNKKLEDLHRENEAFIDQARKERALSSSSDTQITKRLGGTTSRKDTAQSAVSTDLSTEEPVHEQDHTSDITSTPVEPTSTSEPLAESEEIEEVSLSSSQMHQSV